MLQAALQPGYQSNLLVAGIPGHIFTSPADSCQCFSCYGFCGGVMGVAGCCPMPGFIGSQTKL
jgi:hypothetical protein